MQRVQDFYKCWKHQWNLDFGIMCKMVTDYFSVSVASWKWCPHSCNLILGNKKKSQWVESGKWEGYETITFF
jgi:hypothetical protein